MAKRPAPPPASDAPPPAAPENALAGEADVTTPPPVPEHVEAAQAAQVAVARATAPEPAAEAAAPEPDAEPIEMNNADGEASPDLNAEPSTEFDDEAGSMESQVNQQILSSVIDADVLALGLAPPESFALLDATMAQTLGMAMHNAVVRQQADRVVSQALISAACARMIEHASLVIGASSPPAPPKSAAMPKPATEKSS